MQAGMDDRDGSSETLVDAAPAHRHRSDAAEKPADDSNGQRDGGESPADEGQCPDLPQIDAMPAAQFRLQRCQRAWRPAQDAGK